MAETPPPALRPIPREGTPGGHGWRPADDGLVAPDQRAATPAAPTLDGATTAAPAAARGTVGTRTLRPGPALPGPPRTPPPAPLYGSVPAAMAPPVQPPAPAPAAVLQSPPPAAPAAASSTSAALDASVPQAGPPPSIPWRPAGPVPPLGGPGAPASGPTPRRHSTAFVIAVAALAGAVVLAAMVVMLVAASREQFGGTPRSPSSPSVSESGPHGSSAGVTPAAPPPVGMSHHGAPA